MITDLKQLKQLLEMCRKTGVAEIKVGECSIKFGDMPVATQPSQPQSSIPGNAMPSDEEIMFWSAGGGLSEDSQG